MEQCREQVKSGKSKDSGAEQDTRATLSHALAGMHDRTADEVLLDTDEVQKQSMSGFQHPSSRQQDLHNIDRFIHWPTIIP